MANPLPCPHCGAEPTVFFGRNAKECWAYVSCQCGAMTKNMHATTDKAAKELAVETWNTRAERTCSNQAKSPLTFWCSECDCAVEDWTDVGGTLMSVSYCPHCGAKVVGE